MIEKPTKGSPVDTILIAASMVFPLDFVMLTLIVNNPPVPAFPIRAFALTSRFADTVPSLMLVSWFGVFGSALHLHSALCCQETRNAAASHAFALHVSIVARIRNAVANSIPGAAGTIVCFNGKGGMGSMLAFVLIPVFVSVHIVWRSKVRRISRLRCQRSPNQVCCRISLICLFFFILTYFRNVAAAAGLLCRLYMPQLPQQCQYSDQYSLGRQWFSYASISSAECGHLCDSNIKASKKGSIEFGLMMTTFEPKTD
jgi:hypothetical protein